MSTVRCGSGWTKRFRRMRRTSFTFTASIFSAYLPPEGPAVLATLHLPLDWYPLSALKPDRPRTWLHSVSHSQARRAPTRGTLGRPIENGVELMPLPLRKRRFAFALGRICPEKRIR